MVYRLCMVVKCDLWALFAIGCGLLVVWLELCVLCLLRSFIGVLDWLLLVSFVFVVCIMVWVVYCLLLVWCFRFGFLCCVFVCALFVLAEVCFWI